MGFITVYESYTDDHGRPLPIEEGRAAYAKQKRSRSRSRHRHRHRSSTSPGIALIKPPRAHHAHPHGGHNNHGHHHPHGHGRHGSNGYDYDSYEEYEYTRTVSSTRTPSPPSSSFRPTVMPGTYNSMPVAPPAPIQEIVVYDAAPPDTDLGVEDLGAFSRELAARLTGPGSALEKRIRYEHELEGYVHAQARDARIREDQEWLEERHRRYIEDEARRQVREENKAIEMSLMEDAARRRTRGALYDVEHDHREEWEIGGAGAGSGGGLQYAESLCSAESTRSSRGRSRSRSRSSWYDRPHSRVRYVDATL